MKLDTLENSDWQEAQKKNVNSHFQQGLKKGFVQKSLTISTVFKKFKYLLCNYVTTYI